MVSRLILNLRSQAQGQTADSAIGPRMSRALDPNRSRTLTSTIVGYLGEPLSAWFDDDEVDHTTSTIKGTRAHHTSPSGDELELKTATRSDSVSKRAAQGPAPQQIVVEVTHAITTDMRAGTGATPRARTFSEAPRASPSAAAALVPRPPSRAHSARRAGFEHPRAGERSTGASRRPVAGHGAWHPPLEWHLEGREGGASRTSVL